MMLVLLLLPVGAMINREGIETNVTVTVNDTSVLNCDVTGTPSPDVTWSRDSRPIDKVLHANINILASGRQLRIHSAAVTDAAVYRCLATNKAGQDHLDYHLAVHSEYLYVSLCLSGSLSVYAFFLTIFDFFDNL